MTSDRHPLAGSATAPGVGIVDYVYMALFAILGCWVRIALGTQLKTDPAVTSPGGAFFVDLPANMLGSFIIGLMADGATLGLDRPGRFPMQWAALPVSSSQQHNAALQRGIRTGLCGSITTFSSWMKQMGIMICQGRVVQALFGIVVGLHAALVSCAIGEWCAADEGKCS